MKSLLQVIIIYTGIIAILLGNALIFHEFRAKRTETLKIIKKANTLKQKIISSKNEIKTLKDDAIKMAKQKEELENKLDTLKKNLLTKKEFGELLSKLQIISSENRVLIKSMEQYTGDNAPVDYEIAGFKIAATGTFTNLVNMIGEIESLPYLLNTTNFSLNDIDIKTGVIEVNLDIMLYLRKERV